MNKQVISKYFESSLPWCSLNLWEDILEDWHKLRDQKPRHLA